MRWPFGRRASTSDQLELGPTLERRAEPDRNHRAGGRSFYFFDFDDNIAFLTTPTFLFHRVTGAEVSLSSREFAEVGASIGINGPYADYVIDHDPRRGSFRCFRDAELSWVARLFGRRQIFERDLTAALASPALDWRGPSWTCFEHAVFNARPIALITARGHDQRTIRAGVSRWVREGQLAREPNYLGVYPVNNPRVKVELKLPHETNVARLKQAALRHAVGEAFRTYGYNSHHRFGMSDDDPRNIDWIIKEMRDLKREHPKTSFFVIQTTGNQMIKHEVYDRYVVDACVSATEQLTLFDE